MKVFSTDKSIVGWQYLVLTNYNLNMKVKIVFIPAKAKIQYFRP